MTPLLLEDVHKLHSEIADNNRILFQGVFLLLAFMFSAFVAHALTEKAVLGELMLVLVVSGTWFVVRQELMIHSPGSWIAKAEIVIDEMARGKTFPSHDLNGWENDRKAFWFRPIMLTISDIFAASLMWYFLIRLRWEYPLHSGGVATACKWLIGFGLAAIIPTIKLAGK